MDIKVPTTVAELKDLVRRWDNACWFLDTCENDLQYEATVAHMKVLDAIIDSVSDNFVYDDETGEPIGIKK